MFLLEDRKQFVGIIKSDLFVEQCLFWWSAGSLIRDRVMPISCTAPCLQRPWNNSCSKAIRRKCWPIMLKNDSWQSSQNETHLTGVESGKMTIDIHHNLFMLQKYHVLIHLVMSCNMFNNNKNMGSWESLIEDISFSNELFWDDHIKARHIQSCHAHSNQGGTWGNPSNILQNINLSTQYNQTVLAFNEICITYPFNLYYIGTILYCTIGAVL